jgi:NAD(P)-dependent dehydrogenase (short-subunit alcohol dehydrogenase family)
MGFLDGKVAVVTGGNRGIGRGIVEALAAEGATVALTARQASDAERAAREVGGKSRGYPCDVRQETQVDRLFDRVEKDLGGADALVNNTGIGLLGPLADMKPDDWRAVIGPI